MIHRRCSPHSPHLHLLRGRMVGSIFLFSLALAALGILSPAGVQAQAPPPPAPVFQAVDTPILPPGVSVPAAPMPPRQAQTAGPLTGKDLSQVAEVELESTLPINASGVVLGQRVSGLISQIKDRNQKKTDAFVAELIGKRPELRGMPFAMGDACRLKEERRAEFGVAAALVRDSLRRAGEASRNTKEPSEQVRVKEFWKQYQETAPKKDLDRRPHAVGARVAALEQVLGPESAAMQLALVQHLETIADPEAGRALTRLALFAQGDDVREAALKALKQQPNRVANEVLVHGLRYPWPVVAERAGEAAGQLGRKELVPQLVDLLGERDPRLPVVENTEGKKVHVVREMVRVNHTRNCLLCHVPGSGGDQILGLGLTTAHIPSSPGDTPSDGYRSEPGFPENLVRIDVTYLRQDFSTMQAVPNSQPWPQMQRFDFFVRKRQLTEAEATAYAAKLDKVEGASPYRKTALAALRQLTGKDAEPTAEAWRRMLDLPVK